MNGPVRLYGDVRNLSGKIYLCLIFRRLIYGAKSIFRWVKIKKKKKKLWAQFKSTTADDQMPEGAAVQHFTENSSGLAGSVAEGHLATPMPKHRFSSMLSAAKKLTKAGACSLPDDPYVDLALDHFGSNLPVTKIISIPVTEFSCNDRKPGYYADRDREASCKVTNIKCRYYKL